MKFHAFILAAGGLIGAATLVQAQSPGPSDPLADAQGVFGAVVGEAFHRPDPIVAAISTPGAPAQVLGVALRSSLEAPGAVFAGVIKPFADADQADAPAPAPDAAPAPQPHRHVRHRHVASRS